MLGWEIQTVKVISCSVSSSASIIVLSLTWKGRKSDLKQIPRIWILDNISWTSSSKQDDLRLELEIKYSENGSLELKHLWKMELEGFEPKKERRGKILDLIIASNGKRLSMGGLEVRIYVPSTRGRPTIYLYLQKHIKEINVYLHICIFVYIMLLRYLYGAGGSPSK